MIKKNYFIFLTAIALFLISSIAIFAQTSPVRGTIQLKKADGTVVPLAEANIDVYRTDAKGKLPSAKTNKRGEFVFAGLPVGQTFMLAVSAPGVQPQIFPNIKAGGEGFIFSVYEGDGKRLTEEEARQMLANLKNNPASGNTSTADAAAAPQPSAEDAAAAKKAQEEYQKKVAEVNAKNAKAAAANETIKKAMNEGNAAFNSKNYDLALAKYDEGINADPNFVGSAPAFLNNKGVVLKLRAVDTYNTAVKTTDQAQKAEKLAAARKDFQDALASHNQAYQILKNATAAEIPDQNNYNKNKYDALSGLTEIYRLMAQTRNIDSSKSDEARAIFQEYMALETDAAKKQKAQFILADLLREAGDFDNAVVEYRKALEKSPDDPDILAGLGLSLFSVGVSNSNKDQMQEGLNIMERFTQIAPANHALKTSVADAVTYLKTQEKLTPQKTAPARRRN
jgi:tetratricopeptide (TPR) repeat protein